MLHRVVLAEWNTFARRIEAGEREVPRFCRREVESFLRCGILGYGFARVHCGDCGRDDERDHEEEGALHGDCLPHFRRSSTITSASSPARTETSRGGIGWKLSLVRPSNLIS